MRIELKLINDLYDTRGKNPVLLKRGVVSRAYVHPSDIVYVSECLDFKGNVCKNRCKVFCRDLGEVIVKQSVDNIRDAIKRSTEKTFVRGFIRY